MLIQKNVKNIKKTSILDKISNIQKDFSSKKIDKKEQKPTGKQKKQDNKKEDKSKK